jgi:hypothetical protein
MISLLGRLTLSIYNKIISKKNTGQRFYLIAILPL